MKLSNFKIICEAKTSEYTKDIFAEVTVTTGFLFWKKTVVRRIMVSKPIGMWFFIDTGEATPLFEIEKLERAYEAQQKLNDYNRP